MKERNEKKAKFFMISGSEQTVQRNCCKKDRSLMNVPFVTGDKELDAKFVAKKQKKLVCKPERTQNSVAVCVQVFTMQCHMKVLKNCRIYEEI